jgi:HEAT repeat protein
MKGTDPELRRGAVLAAAMKDDKAYIPDLIARITDDEELVVRAARAGLKSLSDGKDFGPRSGSSKAEREAAAKAWRDWAAKK